MKTSRGTTHFLNETNPASHPLPFSLSLSLSRLSYRSTSFIPFACRYVLKYGNEYSEDAALAAAVEASRPRIRVSTGTGVGASFGVGASSSSSAAAGYVSAGYGSAGYVSAGYVSAGVSPVKGPVKSEDPKRYREMEKLVAFFKKELEKKNAKSKQV